MSTARQAATWAGIVLAAAVILVGGWYGYWALARSAQSNQYNVNTHSQQYQAGVVAQERDYYTAWRTATDAGQKAAIADTFCAEYSELNPPTPDLVDAHASMC